MLTFESSRRIRRMIYSIQMKASAVSSRIISRLLLLVTPTVRPSSAGSWPMTLAAARPWPRRLLAIQTRSPYGIPKLPSSFKPSTPTTSLLLGSSTFAAQPGFPSHFLCLRRNQGFQCPSCPKLFPLAPPPAPAPSPAPGGRKRSIRRLMNPTTLFELITRERRSERRASTPRDGVKIRGRWSASCT